MFVLGGFPVSLFLWGGPDGGKSQVGMNWKLSSPWSAYCLCPHPASMFPMYPWPYCSQLFWGKLSSVSYIQQPGSAQTDNVFTMFLRAWSTLTHEYVVCHSHGHLPLLKIVYHMSFCLCKGFSTTYMYPHLAVCPNKFVTASLLTTYPTVLGNEGNAFKFIY